MYNLRNRSFLKEIDFDTRRAALPAAALRVDSRRPSTPAPRPAASRARRSRSSSRRPRPARAPRSRSPPTTRARTSPTSTRRGSQLGHKESIADTARVLGRMYDAIEFRGNAQADVEDARRVRRRARLQRPHRRVAPHPDARRLPHHARGVAQALRRRSPTPSWATAGSTWAARCSSWARSWAPTSASCGPESLQPPADVVAIAHDIADAHRRPDHHHRRPGRRGVGRRLRPHRRVGVDGRGEGRVDRAGRSCSARTR